MKDKSLNQYFSFYILSIIVFFITMSWPQFLNLFRWCHDTYDFGIYSQSLSLMDWNNIDPQLTIYPYKKFRDHFDPILLLLAPLKFVFNTNHILLFVEYLAIVSSPLPFFYYYKKKASSIYLLVIPLVYLIWSKGTLSAISYPVHPTTWSIFGTSLLGYFLLKENKRAIILTLIFLCLFKEEFPFLFISLAGYYFWKKDYKFSFLLFILGILIISFIFFWLPIISPGDSSNHGKELLLSFFANPLSVLFHFKDFGLFKRFYEVPLPLIFLFLIARKNWRNIHLAPLFAVAPLFAIRLLSGRWAFHYMPPLIPLYLWSLMPVFEKQLFSKKSILVFLVIILALDLSYFKKSFNILFSLNDGPSCSLNKNRLESLKKVEAYLKENKEGHVLVMGNHTTNLSFRKNLYQMKAARTYTTSEPYTYLLYEKKTGSVYPFSRDSFDNLFDKLKSNNLTPIIDDEYVFFGKGIFLYDGR